MFTSLYSSLSPSDVLKARVCRSQCSSSRSGKSDPEMRTTALLPGQGSLNDRFCQMEHPFQFQIVHKFVIEGEVLSA